MTATDALGVTILPGDTVRVSSWGGNVRIYDTGRTVAVVGITARGNVVLGADGDPGDPIARGASVRGECLTVLRRDGANGLEGNRERSA